MQIYETSDSINYEIVDHDQISEKKLQEMYYTNQNGKYIRQYKKKGLMFPHHINQLEKNYNSYLNHELNPEFRSFESFHQALMWIASGFQKYNINWWLAGSAALYLRGLNILPHDIDIMTFKSEIAGIKALCEPYIIEPFHHITGWVVKGFGVIEYQYRIDVAFEPEDWVDGQGPVDFGPYAQNHLETVEWQGYEIRIPPIQLHLASNQVRGRNDSVAKIQQYIRQHSNH